MRKPKFLVALFVAALLAPGAHAAKGSWAKVKKLKLGTLLVVKTDDRPQFKCSFGLATEDELDCYLPVQLGSPSFPDPAELRLKRGEIREIRLRHIAKQGVVEDAVFGAGFGAVEATVHPPSNPPRGRDTLILAGACAVTFVVVDHLLPLFHRGVIYKRKRHP